MPMYTQRCDNCGHEFEVFRLMSDYEKNPSCTECKSSTRRIIIGSVFHAFPEEVWEHIDVNPITISSKKQLVETCKKHNCFAPAYMSGDGTKG